MSILDLCERIQETWLSQAISQSTWGYPIIGALHVLAIALFGGAVLVTNLCGLGFVFRREELPRLSPEVRFLKKTGLFVVITTGALLFVSQPARYYASASFRIKMVLLALLFLNAFAAYRARNDSRFTALHAGMSLALWAAALFASRWIAYF